MKENIKPATGRLGVLVVGVGGAVSTTMITGTLAARKGLAKRPCVRMVEEAARIWAEYLENRPSI